MKIKPEQLINQLKRQIWPLYWLSGDEPLLMQESADQIRIYCREQGFIERIVLNIEPGFDWGQFQSAYNNLSLLADRKVLDLRFASNKPDQTARDCLLKALEAPSEDIVILVSSPRLDASTLNTKWFKTLEAKSALIQIWPVNQEGLPSWLNNRLKQAGIEAEPDAMQILLDKIEGNLLAAKQEVERLKLLVCREGKGPVRLDSKTVMQSVADSSRYNAFQLVDAALLGDVARTQKILNRLKAEDTFPLVIVGSITRELRSLLIMVEKRQDGQALNAIMQTSRVWANRRSVVSSAVKRLSSNDIWRMLEQAWEIDQAVKGLSGSNPWDELGILLACLAGKPPVHAPAA
ncbi:MAG: DNA polymerase III subunit delta [Gammaproteobacteria bacterium]|nr:DNA polymerase III subunit delta [Gammaproteobacteria bacterium]MCY4356826.1 DNA polymerase III subunit delta [Gammaproteobacteria bacterium]